MVLVDSKERSPSNSKRLQLKFCQGTDRYIHCTKEFERAAMVPGQFKKVGVGVLSIGQVGSTVEPLVSFVTR